MHTLSPRPEEPYSPDHAAGVGSRQTLFRGHTQDSARCPTTEDGDRGSPQNEPSPLGPSRVMCALAIPPDAPARQRPRLAHGGAGRCETATHSGGCGVRPPRSRCFAATGPGQGRSLGLCAHLGVTARSDSRCTGAPMCRIVTPDAEVPTSARDYGWKQGLGGQGVRTRS